LRFFTLVIGTHFDLAMCMGTVGSTRAYGSNAQDFDYGFARDEARVAIVALANAPPAAGFRRP
jgi:hypothetical protein